MPSYRRHKDDPALGQTSLGQTLDDRKFNPEVNIEADAKFCEAMRTHHPEHDVGVTPADPYATYVPMRFRPSAVITSKDWGVL